MISAGLIKELREKTGAGMLDCKKALEETNGSLESAIDWLREKGISKAAKKSDRIAAEGIASILVEGNKAVILEINSETDFVAKNPEFKTMVDTIASTVLKNDVKTIEEALELKTEDGTINDLVVAKTAKIGEKLSFRRFEIIEKTDSENFGSYIHMGGNIAVLTVLEGGSEEVAKDISMHTAAMKPTNIKRDDIPSDVVEKERKILKEQAIEEGKPAEIAEKMVEGRLQKFFKEVCLEEQQFVKDQDITVLDYAKKNNATIKNVIRFEVGEGMEKRNEDFACEVMNQIKK